MTGVVWKSLHLVVEYEEGVDDEKHVASIESGTLIQPSFSVGRTALGITAPSNNLIRRLLGRCTVLNSIKFASAAESRLPYR